MTQVRISTYDDANFGVNFPYDKNVVEAVRPLARRQGGSPYEPLTKTWIVPNTPFSIEALRAKFPDAVWTMEVQQEVSAVLAEPVLAEADIDISTFPAWVVPKGEEVRPYQKAGILFAIANKRILLGDCVGAGKTNQSILTMVAVKAESVLVVVPKVLKPNWVRNIRRWANIDPLEISAKDAKKYTDMGINEFSELLRKSRFVLTNYEVLGLDKVPGLLRHKWDGVIADECQAVKSHTSKRSQAVTRLSTEYAIFASATPMMSRPIELYPALNFITRGSFGTYWDFGKRYCDPQMVKIPLYARCSACRSVRKGVKGACRSCKAMDSGIMEFKEVLSFDGASNQSELKAALKNVRIARKQTEILSDLPPFQSVPRLIEMSPEHKARYRACTSDLMSYLLAYKGKTPKEAEKTCRAEFVATFNEARAILSAAKIEAMIEDLTAAVRAGDNAVVFTNHHEVVKLTREAIAAVEGPPIPVFTFTGADDPVRREVGLQTFQQSKGAVEIVMITAGGSGLDMFSANHMFFLDMPWTPASINQAEGRCYRPGQTKPTFSFRYFVADTYDAKVMKLLVKKQENSTDVLDSDDMLGEIIAELLHDRKGAR